MRVFKRKTVYQLKTDRKQAALKLASLRNKERTQQERDRIIRETKELKSKAFRKKYAGVVKVGKAVAKGTKKGMEKMEKISSNYDDSGSEFSGSSLFGNEPGKKKKKEQSEFGNLGW